MLADAIINSYLFGISLTVVLYAVSEIVTERLRLRVIPPILLACPAIIAVIALCPGVEYKHYALGADFINFLLGPATIALALPLYKNRAIIKKHAPIILSGVTLATLTAILAVYFCGKASGVSEPVLLSLVPKSVTTPIAIEVAQTIGGIPAITTAAVICSGMLGAAFNHRLLKLFGIRSDLSAGLAIGASSHGIGTSACASVSALQLAVGGTAIALTGIATSILAPLLLPLLQSL